MHPWCILQRIRKAYNHGDFKLSHVVEADETFVSGKEGNKREAKKLKAGRGAVGKAAIVSISERRGRVTEKQVERTDVATLKGFVEGRVELGAVVCTDEAGAYRPLANDENRSRHETVKHGDDEYARDGFHTNGIESVWAVLKRSLYVTWHHVSRNHPSRHVNKAAFHLNECNCDVDSVDRINALVRRVDAKHNPYMERTA